MEIEITVRIQIEIEFGVKKCVKQVRCQLARNPDNCDLHTDLCNKFHSRR